MHHFLKLILTGLVLTATLAASASAQDWRWGRDRDHDRDRDGPRYYRAPQPQPYYVPAPQPYYQPAPEEYSEPVPQPYYDPPRRQGRFEQGQFCATQYGSCELPGPTFLGRGCRCFIQGVGRVPGVSSR